MHFTFEQAKHFFIDTRGIKNAVQRANTRALARVGAMIRIIARRSIRNRKRISAPGQPPSSHTGLLKEFIFYHTDFSMQQVIIGPAKIHRRNTFIGKTEPEVLEFGGVVQHKIALRDFRKRKKWGDSSPDFAVKREYYRARPFMGPALNTARRNKKIAGAWQDILSAKFVASGGMVRGI